MIIFLEQRTIDISIGWLDTCVAFPGTIIFLYLSWQIYKSWIYLCVSHHSTDLTDTHYNDVIMSAMTYQITSLTIVYSTVYLDADQRKHQSSASLVFVRGINRWPVNSSQKGPVSRKIIPFGDVIMTLNNICRTDGNRIPGNEKINWVGFCKPLKRWTYIIRDALK